MAGRLVVLRATGALTVWLLVAGQAAAPDLPVSAGLYQLPYVDGTRVAVFDDFATHRPVGRIDFTAEPKGGLHRVATAAAGRVVAIEDGYAEQQSGRAAKDCRNNFIWIAHANGEWTNYSHIRAHSATRDAGLKVDDRVKSGQFIGYEGAVGCAMLDHVHFEVIAPAAGSGIDRGGFALDNAQSQRERRPQFCTVPGGKVVKGSSYVAAPCLGQSATPR